MPPLPHPHVMPLENLRACPPTASSGFLFSFLNFDSSTLQLSLSIKCNNI
jgi:hypothetical protein